MALGNFALLGVLHRGNDMTYMVKARMKGDTTLNLCVLKIFPKTKRSINIFANEKAVLKEIGPNPYVVGLGGFVQTSKCLCIKFEYLENGSLRNHLDVDGRFDEIRTTYYSACVLCALQFLHCSMVTHGDVHLRNMMLDGRGVVKLIDFGRSQLRLTSSVFGTSEFHSDLKQLGASIYEMLTGEMVMHPDMSLIKKDQLGKDALDLIENLLVLDRKQGSDKPEDARDLLALPLFKRLNASQLQSGCQAPPKFNKLPEKLLPLRPEELEFDPLEQEEEGSLLSDPVGFDDVPYVDLQVEDSPDQ